MSIGATKPTASSSCAMSPKMDLFLRMSFDCSSSEEMSLMEGSAWQVHTFPSYMSFIIDCKLGRVPLKDRITWNIRDRKEHWPPSAFEMQVVPVRHLELIIVPKPCVRRMSSDKQYVFSAQRHRFTPFSSRSTT